MTKSRCLQLQGISNLSFLLYLNLCHWDSKTFFLERYYKQVSLEPDIVMTEKWCSESSLGSYLNIDQFKKGLFLVLAILDICKSNDFQVFLVLFLEITLHS